MPAYYFILAFILYVMVGIGVSKAYDEVNTHKEWVYLTWPYEVSYTAMSMLLKEKQSL